MRAVLVLVAAMASGPAMAERSIDPFEITTQRDCIAALNDAYNAGDAASDSRRVMLDAALGIPLADDALIASMQAALDEATANDAAAAAILVSLCRDAL